MTKVTMTDVVALDFETYFDAELSLRKQGQLEYVRDPRFEIHGCALAYRNSDAASSNAVVTEWYTSMRSLARRVRQLAPTVLVAHNANFDALVWREHVAVADVIGDDGDANPLANLPWHDTLTMSRLFFPRDCDKDLDRIAAVLLGEHKHTGVLPKIKGKRPGDLAADEAVKLAEYAKQDAALCLRVYEALRPHTPQFFLDVMEWAVDISTRATLHVDRERVQNGLAALLQRREELARKAGLPAELLRSREQLLEWLRKQEGDAPPSLRKNDGDTIVWFADRPHLQPVWEARQAYASPLEIRRAERVLRITKHNVSMPMPLGFAKAHTLRFGGEAKINPQNFSRGSPIRTAIKAPPGHKLIVSDLSQIELRLNMLFCGQYDWYRRLVDGEDPYKLAAAEIFNCSPDDIVDKDDDRRRLGKARELGSGYRMSGRTFRIWCAGGPLGMDPIMLSEAEANRIIASYRCSHDRVAAMWHTLDRALTVLAALPPGRTAADCGRPESMTIGPITIRPERIDLPHGLWLDYTGAHASPDGFAYGIGGALHFLHGGKLLENIIQALANIVLCERLLVLRDIAVWQIHDEIVCVAPDNEVDAAVRRINDAMTAPVEWMPELKLDCETKVGEYYA